MKRQSRKAGPELDHRARVGLARRVRTETRLLAAALRVFAEKGPDAPVVDDFVRAAGISRGSFYNHHQSVPELLEATSVWNTEGAVREIERALEGIRSPAMRLGTGLRLFLLRAESDPVWCRFVARSGSWDRSRPHAATSAMG
jgi:AcrR family transcriptional regulator